VTTYAAPGGKPATIKFDLSKVPGNTQVVRAHFCFWVFAGGQSDRTYRTWGFNRWTQEKEFAGFKVFRGPTPDEAKVLDVKFPFQQPGAWRFEFDVTGAVKDWLKDPAANDGLSMNFALQTLPTDKAPKKAWMKPYLQITYAGENKDRPPDGHRLGLHESPDLLRPQVDVRREDPDHDPR